ncbi:hypothetical protein IW16_12465 [Chryseobacterium vrystaatense]|uniref:Uncharacterized protein n=1 Tax=Chryseobacterium vrystaatense TaxID=307480 RepID=A0ABR4UL88_9FLAO|nr:hypothetical protein IW16_12465 [Chryseobacterium vrystaatense]
MVIRIKRKEFFNNFNSCNIDCHFPEQGNNKAGNQSVSATICSLKRALLLEYIFKQQQAASDHAWLIDF